MKKILAVEDEGGIRMILEVLLAQTGYSFMIAKSAEDGIRILENEVKTGHGGIGLIISDLNCSKVVRDGGIQVLQYAKDHLPSVRRVLMSGAPPEKIPEVAEVFLVKPFAFREFLSVVKSMLQEVPAV